jgi:ubiquinone biosynthesis O-methyltransferase
MTIESKKFDKAHYEQWYEHRHEERRIWWRDLFYGLVNTYDYVDTTIKFCKGKRVLDIGCGLGRLAIKAAKTAESVLAIDISEEAIRKARELSKKELLKNIEFQVTTFEKFSTKEKFDIIYMTEVIEHLYDIEKNFGKIASLLNAGGYLIITTPNANNRIHRFRQFTDTGFLMHKGNQHDDPGHVNYFAPPQIQNLLDSNKLKLLRLKEFPRVWKEHMFVLGQKL